MRNQDQLEDRVNQVKEQLAQTSDPNLTVRYEGQLAYLSERLTTTQN